MSKWEKEKELFEAKQEIIRLFYKVKTGEINPPIEAIDKIMEIIKSIIKEIEAKAEQRGVEKVEKKIYELKVRSFYSKEDENLEVNDKKISVYHTPENEWISRLELLKKLKKLKEEE